MSSQCGGGASDAHQRSGDEGAAAERGGEVVDAHDLAQVEARRHEDELRCAGRARPAARWRRSPRRSSMPGRTRSCVAAVAPSTEICTHCDGERREPIGGGVVDAAAVGLDLERDARRGEPLEDLPAVRRRRAARRRRRRRRECRTRRCAGRGRAPRRGSSSSRQALSGPDSSQHARQRALQRLVSCQARNRGAR